MPHDSETPAHGQQVITACACIVHEVLGAFTYVNQIKGSHSVEVIFKATLLDSPETITLNSEDHSDFVWADAETATKLYIEHSNKGADDQELAAIKKVL